MAEIAAPNHLWVYEVTTQVDRSVIDQFAAIVRHHMEVISALPGFHNCPTWHQAEDTPSDGAVSETVTWTIRYFADNRESIQNYFDTLAPTLRVETIALGSKVQASRRIYQPVAPIFASVASAAESK